MKQIKRTKKVAKKHESGRSMIEMVGVLAIMGLITAAAFVLITSALRSQRLVRIDDDVSAIAAGVRLLYANQPSFSTVANTTTVDGKTVNTALNLIGYGNVKTPFNTAYNVAACGPMASTGTAAAATCTDGGSTNFKIYFDADSAATCTALAKRLEGFNGGHTMACSGNDSKTVSIAFAKYAEN